MYRLFLALIAVACVSSAVCGERWLGGDISMLPVLRSLGAVYCDSAGNAVEPLEFMAKRQWNVLRVRLFVDPQNAPGEHHDQGVCQDLDYVVSLGREIKQRGFAFMLDFHYSDTWADPAKQFTPLRWQNVTPADLPDSIYTYTRECLQTLVAAGAAPDMIQVGNEVTFGMDWPAGRVEPMENDGWGAFTQMLNAGARACREVCPQAKLIVHTEKAGNWPMTRAYYTRLDQSGVDYDIIGLSYYPMWHGTITNLAATADSIAVTFPGREVMIVEAAYYYDHDGVNRGEEDFTRCPPGTVEGQRQFTADLVAELRHHPVVTGLLWWYPEENSHGISGHRHGGLNRGLFDNNTGRALPAMYEFTRFADPVVRCPRCGSDDVARYLYGLVRIVEGDLKKRIDSRQVRLGGCVISENSPRYACNACGLEWGSMMD